MEAMIFGAAGGRVESRPIRVLLADDHAMVREGMAEMLSIDERIEVVAQAADGAQAVSLARRERPEVVILDVQMPVMGAQPALRRLLEISPPPKVIVVTVFTDDRLVRELLRLGASAFMTKNASTHELIAMIHSVARGTQKDNVVLSVPRNSLDNSLQSAADSREYSLSHQEMEVLRSTAQGRSNRETANRLHLSETTVKRHLSNTYTKLEVHSRSQAVSKALSEGWIRAQDISQDD